MMLIPLFFVGVLTATTIACGGDEPARRSPPPQAAPAQLEYSPELTQYCERFGRQVALLDKGWTHQEIGEVSVICSIVLE